MILYDARGNPFQGSLDTIGGETFTDARVASATLGSVNAELVMDIQGKATAAFDIRASAMNATLVFEGTLDGSNYYTLPAWIDVAQTRTAAVVITTTAGSAYFVNCTGWRRVRCRVSTYTSGSCVVHGRATEAIFEQFVKLPPSTLHVTATAAANTAATATLPAAGAGLFHYITHIHICRNATTVLLGSATLIHTTTNLPGSPAWSVGNAMSAGGTQPDVDYAPTTPLKSSVANTATTVVAAAAGAAVLGRVNVSYFVGA